MISTISDATREVCKLIDRQENKKLGVILDSNKGRYKLAYLFNEKQEREIILIVFKRAHFLSYSKQFNVDAGHGESINKEDLDKAISRGINRVFIVYNDGKIYMIHQKIITSQAFVRKTDNEGKETYSFDIKLLTRFN